MGMLGWDGWDDDEDERRRIKCYPPPRFYRHVEIIAYTGVVSRRGWWNNTMMVIRGGGKKWKKIRNNSQRVFLLRLAKCRTLSKFAHWKIRRNHLISARETEKDKWFRYRVVGGRGRTYSADIMTEGVRAIPMTMMLLLPDILYIPVGLVSCIMQIRPFCHFGNVFRYAERRQFWIKAFSKSITTFVYLDLH